MRCHQQVWGGIFRGYSDCDRYTILSLRVEAILKRFSDNKEIFEEMPEGEILPPGEKPDFHWKKDGAPFQPDERFKVLMGDDEDSLALVFQHVKPDDVGLYTCVAQTSRGHISCSAELTVHGTVNQLFRYLLLRG